MSKEELHDIECAEAAFALLLERAERAHGMYSKEARAVRREWLDYRKKKRLN